MPKDKTHWSPEPVGLEPEGPTILPTVPKTSNQPQPVLYDHRGERILPRPIGFKR